MKHKNNTSTLKVNQDNHLKTLRLKYFIIPAILGSCAQKSTLFGIKMCHMPKKDKFGTNLEKYCIFLWSLL